MFYYLSFLRPPPTHTRPTRTIHITPQIANDLRTEYDTLERDILYSWSLITTPTISTLPTETKPAKLTTWRQSTAYKEIPVPIPPGVRDGQIWRLMLICGPFMASSPSAQSQSFTVDLHAKEMGRIPFPVLSMPIQFTSHIHKGPSDLKQERIERIYTFPLPSPNTMKALETNDRITRAAIRVTEQTSFDLDKKVWDSGIGLSSWLVNLAHNEIVSLSNEAPNLDTIKALIDALRDSLFANQPRCIIELGAGTGVVALTIATLRRALTTIEGLQGHVITTDLPSAMPLLEHNIHSNARLFLDCSRAMPEAAVLDWDSDEIPDFIQVVAKERTSKGFTAIVMADVAYNTSSFPSLVRTLSRLVKLSEKPPLILLGYKERDPAERDLWNMAKDVAGIDFSLVGTKSGMRDPPIEIWIGQVMND